MTQVLMQVLTCDSCGRVVVYFGGRYQHLTDKCPDHRTELDPRG